MTDPKTTPTALDLLMAWKRNGHMHLICRRNMAESSSSRPGTPYHRATSTLARAWWAAMVEFDKVIDAEIALWKQEGGTVTRP